MQALAVGLGLPNGLTFANPPLFKYLLLAEYAATFGVERLLGLVRSPRELLDAFRADPSLLYGIARATSATLGALVAVASGLLAARVGGHRAGWIAAGICAVAFLLVREAHFGVDDTLVTLLVTLGLLACVGIARGGARREYAIAGALTGLAFAAKYDGIALLVPLVVAHAVNARGRRDGQGRPGDLALALFACGIATLIAFPSLVTEPGRVLGDIQTHLYQSAVGGYDGIDPSGGYTFYARTLTTGLGWPLVAMALLGAGRSVVRRDLISLVVISLPVALLLALGSQKLYFARFALPALPAVIVEASLMLEALLAWRAAVGALALALVVLPTLLDSVQFDTLMTRADTRTLARQWIDASLPAGSTLAVDAPPLGPSLAATGLNVEVANDWSLFDLTPADYRARGIDYVVVSSFTAEARAIDPLRETHRQAFDSELPTQASVVAQFRPYSGDAEPPFEYDQIYGPYTDLDRLQRPGPTVTVYRLTR